MNPGAGVSGQRARRMKAAVPTLRAMLTEAEPGLREEARRALEGIDLRLPREPG